MSEHSIESRIAALEKRLDSICVSNAEVYLRQYAVNEALLDLLNGNLDDPAAFRTRAALREALK